MYCNLVTTKEGYHISIAELEQMAINLQTAKELYDRLIGNGFFVTKGHMIHIVALLAKEGIFLSYGAV